MSSTRVSAIEIEAFRGFNEAQRLECDADFIVLAGGNGVGKTSVIDAVSWLLTGSMTHLRRRRQRMNDEMVVNAYRRGEQSRVAMEFRTSDGPVRAVRTGNGKRSTLQLERPGGRRVGDAAEIDLARWLGYDSPSELAAGVELWAVLRQDEIRAVLDADPDDVHRRLRDLLGLAVLDDFEADAEADYAAKAKLAADAAAACDSARKELLEVEAELQEVDAAIAGTSTAGTAAAELAERLHATSQFVQIHTPYPETIDGHRALLADLRVLYSEVASARTSMEAIDSRLSEMSPLLEAASPPSPAGAIQEAATAVAELRRQLDAARRRADQWSALAAAAAPLLTDTCPVCNQSIDRSQVTSRLEAVADPATAGEIRELEIGLARATDHHRDLVRQTEAAELAAKQAAASERERAELRERRAILLGELAATRGGYALVRLPQENADEVMPSALEALRVLGQAARQLVAVEEAGEQATRRAQLASRQSAVSARVTAAETEQKRVRTLVTKADGRRRAAREAAVDVTTAALESLNPHFGQVYRRIAPHPTFTDLGLTHEVYRNEGRTLPVLEDPVAHVRANPGLICSVGQLNVVALSYFLAMALLKEGGPLPFMLLDDPLQSLDDANVLGFADLCRSLRRSRQVFVTTHEQRYADLLQRKLRPIGPDESAIVFRFEAWDRSGPSINREVAEPLAPVTLLTA